jgi:integrase/recombinase XerD
VAIGSDGDDDPLFPATEVAIGPNQRFVPIGLARKHWIGTASIRRIFKDAFAGAGLPYANPHSFLNTLMQLAYWSQNFRHDGILTTLGSYGEAEIMSDLATPVSPP